MQQQQQHNTPASERPTRTKISRLGDKLVDTTESVLKGIKRIISAFNRNLEYVRIDTFVYEEADYMFVSEKEVKEVKEIFRAFDIDIKTLS